MKKLLLVLMVIGCAAILSAEVNFYGSARFGWWYEMYNKDYMGGDDGYLNFNYFMQGNSRFGANFTHDKIEGNVELGLKSSGVVLRKAYGKYDMGY